MRIFGLTLLILIFVGIGVTQAEDLNYNLVQLGYRAEKQVDNDVMLVSLETSSQANTAAMAASKVNEEMLWALSQVEGVSAIKKETTSYQTYPLYDNKVITSWRVSQRLELESAEISLLTKVVGTLQKKLKVRQMQFVVSEKKRKQVVDSLLVKALKGFGEKAKLVADTLGGERYKLVTLTVDEDGGHPMPYRGAKMMMAMESAESASPTVEGGDSKVEVSVTGTIQVIY